MARGAQGGFLMFKPMMKELLNIEQFYQMKLNKIKTIKNLGEFQGASLWY